MAQPGGVWASARYR